MKSVLGKIAIAKKSAAILLSCSSLVLVPTVIMPNVSFSKDTGSSNKIIDKSEDKSKKAAETPSTSSNLEDSDISESLSLDEVSESKKEETGVKLSIPSTSENENLNKIPVMVEVETKEEQKQSEVQQTSSKEVASKTEESNSETQSKEEQKQPEVQQTSSKEVSPETEESNSKTECKEEQKQPEVQQTPAKEEDSNNKEQSSETESKEEQKQPEVQQTPVEEEDSNNKEQSSETQSKEEQKQPEVQQTPVEEEDSNNKEQSSETQSKEGQMQPEVQQTPAKEETPNNKEQSSETESKEEQQQPGVQQTPAKEETPNNKEQSSETESKEEQQQPGVQQTPAKEEDSNNKEQSSETQSKEGQTQPEVQQTPSKEVAPNSKTENEKEQSQASSQESKSKETSSQKAEADLIDTIKKAVEKTKNADSAYYIRKRTGAYPGTEKIKYSKTQNRRWYSDGTVEEYIEGFSNNYPPISQGRVSSYYAQTRWVKKNGSSEWIKESPLISYFGISELSWLDEIKSVELKGTRPFAYYIITLDRDYANKKAIDLLNAGYYLENGIFKTDVKIAIQIDHEGYIRSFDCNWGEEVLNNPFISSITMSLAMGEFNKTVVERPTDLNDKPDERQKPSDELTQTQKAQIMDRIYDSFEQTLFANSATYELNGTTVKYNREKNNALISDSSETTYYEGTEGMYVDHNYVGPSYYHNNWTKSNNTNEWKQNKSKHKIFTPQELYFLDHDFIVIHDVTKVEKVDDLTTYTITILKYGANLAYSHVYGVSNKFNDNITISVSIDNDGYVRGINADFGDNKIDLKIYNIENTVVTKPEGI